MSLEQVTPSRSRSRVGQDEPVVVSPAVETDPNADIKAIIRQGGFRTELASKPNTRVTTGKPVRLVTNMYRIRFQESVVYHYDIKFHVVKTNASGGDQSHELKAARKVKQVFEKLKLANSDIGQSSVFFDGKKNMYSAGNKLTYDHWEDDFDAVIDEEPVRIHYEYKDTGSFSNLVEDPLVIRQDAIQALEIGLGYEAGKKMIRRGGKLFERDTEHSNPIDLENNLLLRMGFVKSVRSCESGLMINLDRAAAVFQKGGNLIDVFLNVINFDRERYGMQTKQLFQMDVNLVKKVERELSGLTVKVMHPKLPYTRKRKIDRDTIIMGRVDQVRFDWSDESSGQAKNVTVKEYYQLRYQIALQPHFTCLAVGPDRRTYIPIELCYLLHEQYYDKQMHQKIKFHVTRETIKKPHERFPLIQKSLEQFSQITSSNALNTQISRTPVSVIGMVQDPPVIQWKASTKQVSQNPRKGNPCDFECDKGLFNKTVPLIRWAILQVQYNARQVRQQADAQVRDFPRVAVKFAAENGWSVNSEPDIKCFNYLPHTDGYEDLKQLMTRYAVRANLQMLVVIIPNSIVYADVKQIGNKIGLLTQCILLDVDKTLRGNEISNRVFNIILKMNSKIGGVNAKVASDSKPAFLRHKVMVVGMDVFHPGEGSLIRDSLAGIVASYTPSFTEYYQAAKAQPQDPEKGFVRKEEITEAVYEVLLDFFKRWKKANGFYPENILIYRDGVSNGQFERVRIMELDQVYRAMAALGFRAAVTFVTVQKRHNFRMALQSGRNGFKNPLPGTVVDRDVVSASRFEFYLNSHHAIQGTSKPSHYCVVHNECGLDSDQMVAISNYLCYLCARCYKPISIPAPVRYAHLVAEMASELVESCLRNGLSGTTDDWIRVHEDFVDKLTYV